MVIVISVLTVQILRHAVMMVVIAVRRHVIELLNIHVVSIHIDAMIQILSL
jgi:hypothetical protein